jgi:hypothetical protein
MSQILLLFLIAIRVQLHQLCTGNVEKNENFTVTSQFINNAFK